MYEKGSSHSFMYSFPFACTESWAFVWILACSLPSQASQITDEDDIVLAQKLFGKKTPNFGNRNGNVNTFTFKDFLSEKTFLGFVEYKTRIVNF